MSTDSFRKKDDYADSHDRHQECSETTPSPPPNDGDPNVATRAEIAKRLGDLKLKVNAALHGFREVSPATAACYKRLYQRVRSGKALAEFATNRGYYYQARAAFVYEVSRELRQCDSDLDVAMAAEDLRRAKALVDRIKELLRALDPFPPDRERQNCRRTDFFGEFRQLADDRPRDKPNSKRRGLAALPKDWQSRVFRAATAAKSKYVLPIAAQLLTGCRPVELVTGIMVRIDPDGALVFRITGAKVRPGHQGQAWREITVRDKGNPAVQFVKDAIQAGDDGSRSKASPFLTIVAPSAKGLGSAVARFGRAISSPAHSISPYSARHQLASDLKADGASRDECAAALGHLVDRTSQGYGRGAAGRGGKGLTASAAHPVKHTRSDPSGLRRRRPKP